MDGRPRPDLRGGPALARRLDDAAHLSTTYRRRWRRTAPAELRVQANPVYFDPRKLPEGTPGRTVPEVLARMAADKDRTP
ncbi:hypothetical protein GCM10025734_00800 [Kitasatospora paranensis]